MLLYIWSSHMIIQEKKVRFDIKICLMVLEFKCGIFSHWNEFQLYRGPFTLLYLRPKTQIFILIISTSNGFLIKQLKFVPHIFLSFMCLSAPASLRTSHTLHATKEFSIIWVWMTHPRLGWLCNSRISHTVYKEMSEWFLDSIFHMGLAGCHVTSAPF